MYIFTYIQNLLSSGSGGVPVERPPQALDGKAQTQPKQHPSIKLGEGVMGFPVTG